MMVDSELYIGRQPILNDDKSLSGYELLFRSGKKDFNVDGELDDKFATARVLATLLNSIGLEKIIGSKKAFINVDREILFSDILQTLPKDRFIIEILEHVKPEKDVLAKIDEIRADGFTVALDDFFFSKKNINYYKPYLSRIDLLKVDIAHPEHDEEVMKLVLPAFSKMPFKLLAEKVETHDEYERYKGYGYELFQGFFFAKPEVLKNKNNDPSKMAIMNTLGLITSEADVSAITDSFKSSPDMSVNLLKFLNSAMFSFSANISSISHAINLIGRKNLKQWLTLMLYAGADMNTDNNPLFELAKNRAELMSILSKKITATVDSDMIYFTGLLSLLDVILEIPKENIFDDIHVEDEIKEAILEYKGSCGELLMLAIADEGDDVTTMNQMLNALALSAEDLNEANLEVYEKSEKVG
jgi:EAL and modified HD-GYP domain-containing signal transduction protein